jgi:hypothetical protein
LGELSLRRKISGLLLSILAFVGDANDGRFGDDAGLENGSVGVVDSGWTATAVRGDVLRLLGAEVSIAQNLGF